MKLPTLVNLDLNLGKVRLAQGDVQLATEYFRSVRYRCPDHQEAIELDGKATNLLKSQRSLEPILINTIPKSGSIFICNALCAGLDLYNLKRDTVPALLGAMMCGREMRIVGGGFPHAQINQDLLRVFASQEDGVVTHEHLPASSRNLLYLNQFLDRFVVHLRDPRQAMLSHLQHVKEVISVDPYQLIIEEVPEGFFEWSLAKQISWGIDTWLPLLVDWVEGWLQASGDPRYHFEILFTRYEDLEADQEQFFYSILEFFDIDLSRFVLPEKPEKGPHHYRNLTTDDWRHVFTDAQRERATNQLPQPLIERFEWE